MSAAVLLFVLASVFCQMHCADHIDVEFTTRGPDDDIDLDNATELKITSMLVEPYLSLLSGEAGLTQDVEGIIPEILEALCFRGYMACNYDLVVVNDGKQGERNMDGTWTGMIGELVREEVDFIAGPLDITKEREEVLQFSKPYQNDVITVVVNKDSDINTLDDMLNSNITYGTLKSESIISNYLRSHPEPPYSVLWGVLGSDVTDVETTAEAVEKIEKNEYAFVTTHSGAKAMMRDHCSLKMIDGAVAQLGGLGFGFRKDEDNEFVNKINDGLLNLLEDGSLHEITMKWFASTCGVGCLSPLSLLTTLAVVLGAVLLSK